MLEVIDVYVNWNDDEDLIEGVLLYMFNVWFIFLLIKGNSFLVIYEL